MALRRGQMDDVLPEEVVRDVDAFRKNPLQHANARLRLEWNPLHVLVLEVVEDRNSVPFENGDVMIQVFALERVGHDRLVLDADLVGEAAPRERLDGPFEL